MTFSLHIVPSHIMTPVQASDVITLCSAVFQCDYAFYMNLDLVRVHVLGYDGDRLVAHALWLTRRLRIGVAPWLRAAYIEGVATHADFRGRGYGSAVMRRVQREIGDFDLGALSPAQPDWYARLGWVQWRGPLFIAQDAELRPTPEDCVMIYRTPHSGIIDLDASLTGECRPFEPW